MNEELLKKLRYKDGPAAILHAPEGFQAGIEASDKAAGKYNFVLLFVNNAQETGQRVPETLKALNEDAVFWIVYPKQSSKIKTDINRDVLASLVQDTTPYRPVSNVAVDDTWSALRFRPKDQVKSSK